MMMFENNYYRTSDYLLDIEFLFVDHQDGNLLFGHFHLLFRFRLACLHLSADHKEHDQQDHQNRRQYECRKDYGDVFIGVDKLFWVPSFLLREDPNQPVLKPVDLIPYMNNPEIAEAAELNDELSQKLHQLRDDGWMILMEAGGATGDEWIRREFKD